MSGDIVRVMLADSISSVSTEMLEAAGGFEVHDRRGISAEDLVKEIKDYDVLIIRSRTKVTAQTLEAASRLKLIGRAGIGIDNIDLAEATRRGVVVMNAPRGNSETTAELAIAHMFSVARHLPNATESMRAGKWEKKKFSGRQIAGSTLGVVGMGNIGQIVASKGLKLGMKVLGFDPFVTGDKMRSLGIEHHPDLNTLMAASDFVTIHTPITPKTRHLISTEQLSHMKSDSYLINCARGGVVDEKALYTALSEGTLAGAGFDVFEEEPVVDNPLLSLPNVFTTPHIGAATKEAQLKVAIELVEQIIDYFVRNVVRNAVNLPRMQEKEQEELWPFVMLAKTVGNFAGHFHSGTIEEITVSYQGSQVSEENSKMVTNAGLKGVLSAAMESPITLVNASMVATDRGLKIREEFNPAQADLSRTVSIRVSGDAGSHEVQGAVFGEDDIRIVRLNGYRLEAVPTGALLITQNEDVPGIIGKVGTHLGAANINISRMQVSLNRSSSNAAMAVWSLDEAIPDSVLKSIADLDHIESCKQISL